MTRFLDEFPLENIHSLKDDHPVRFYANTIAQKFRIPFQLNRLQPHLRLVSPDIVHSHFCNVGVDDRFAIDRHPARHVVSVYGYDVSMLPRQQPELREAYHELFRKVDVVLCEGTHMAQQVHQLGCPEDRTVVQHLGVDIDKFEFRPRSWHPDRTLRILIAGSFREKKGIPYAISAIGQLNRDVQVTIIGDADSSAASTREKEKILKAIESASLTKRVRLLGYLAHAEMINVAFQNDLFVSTSVTAANGDNEGGAPVVLAEMAATGMPIISSFHCDIPEVVLHDQTGWLAHERDVDSIATAIDHCLSSHEKWHKILQAGRNHIEREYNLARQGQRLGTIYREL